MIPISHTKTKNRETKLTLHVFEQELCRFQTAFERHGAGSRASFTCVKKTKPKKKKCSRAKDNDPLPSNLYSLFVFQIFKNKIKFLFSLHPIWSNLCQNKFKMK